MIRLFVHPAPNFDAIRAAVRPQMPTEFVVGLAKDGIAIDAPSWEGVDLGAVQAAITATPLNTPTLAAQSETDRMPVVLQTALLTLLDLINLDRQARGAAAITPTQYIAAVKAKL